LEQSKQALEMIDRRQSGGSDKGSHAA